MEQFSILPLGTFPAAGEDQHRGVQAGGIGTGPALGNNDLDEEDLPAGAMAVRQLVRILVAASSSQSCTIHFNR